MNTATYTAQQTKAPTGAFLASGVLMFTLTLSAFTSIGFVPYYVDGDVPRAAAPVAQTMPNVANNGRVALSGLPQLGDEQTFLPERITASSIGLDLPIANPNTTSINALDEELKSAVVRYPGSAVLGGTGNMLIFGHSSHLPVVYNQMYKAFNALPELEQGDVITVHGGGREYIYRVSVVRRTDAHEEMIDLSSNGKRMLTLSTCDTFGAKSARWVVEAEFMGSYDAGEYGA